MTEASGRPPSEAPSFTNGDDTPPTGEHAPVPPLRAVWPKVARDDAPSAPPAPRGSSTTPPVAVASSTGARWPVVTGPPPPPPPAVPRARRRGASGGRPWLSVAVVAAVVGAVIGGGIVWLTRGAPGVSTRVTIQESLAQPGGAQVVDGSIPSLVRAVAPSVVSIDVSNGFAQDQGTGMIITPGGLVVTNNHVIAAASTGGTITVTRTGTSTTLSAVLLGTDPTDDVALLQIEGATHLPAVTFGDSSKLEVGDGVVAIGNALGLSARTPTVTQGIVSALGRTVTAGDALSNTTEQLTGMIQTDAAINPGNSGGPLIDSNGHVVGMNTAVAGETNSGENTQNIGFAIPAARIESLLGSLERSTPHPEKPGGYLGVVIESVTPTLERADHLSVATGAYVLKVDAGQPAEAAGMRTGDVIVSIGGTTTPTDLTVGTVMGMLRPGQTVPVVIERGDTTTTLSVTVVAWPLTRG